MKKLHKYIGITAIIIVASGLFACNPIELDGIADPNNPTEASVAMNASRAQIQFLLTGLEARHRAYVFIVTAGFGTFGREIWYLNASDPRWQTDWLGQGGRAPDRAFFVFGETGGAAWAFPYQAIKQANVLVTAAQNAPTLTDADRKALAGFAKTIQGYQFMIPANFVYQNGIRIDVSDPFNPGPFVSYENALNHIKSVLDGGAQDLSGTGTFPFRLTPGFNEFNTIERLRQVNRAIAARLNAYRKDWQGVLNALGESFMNLSGPLNVGPAHVYGAAPDIFNPLFFVLDAPLTTMIVVHPSVLLAATPGDKRVTDKFFRRTTPVVITTEVGPLTGTHQDRRWPLNTSPIPFIKNEELILLKAEAHANLNQPGLAVEAINIIRNAAIIGNYTGATDQASLINEILYQRRYSLWAEPWGHRWIDARRYNKLNEIPATFDGGTIFTQFPHPQAEVNWDQYTGK